MQEKYADSRKIILRQKAEEIFSKRKTETGLPKSEEEILSLVHELQVHQIELEMQNEELRQAHNESEKLREKYFNVYHLAPVGYVTLDDTGTIAMANLAISQMLGVDMSDIITRRFQLFMAREDIPLFNKFCTDILREGRKQLCEVRLLRNGEPSVYARLEGSAINDTRAGSQIIVSVSDMTERKKAENALQKSEAFIKDILQSVGEGFVIIDPEYKITLANRAYCEQTKFSCEDIVGRHCYEVSHHLDKPCFMADVECAPRHTFMTGEPYRAIHTHYDKEGNPVYVETKSFPMKDSTGKIYAVIETQNNITEKKRLEEQLRHAQKMEAIGTLAGGIAHDFNNLLNVIIGYGAMMQMKMKPDDPQMEQLKEILVAGDKAAQLTRGLLTFSRKQAMEIRTVNLNDIVEGFKKMLSRIIGEDIELKITLSEKDLTAKADIVQIEQVLMNLAANARDAMPKGGTLTIETRPVRIDREFIKAHGYGEPGMYALITVSDTGTGMDEKTRERIFEPYFTTKEIGRGTGLGLAIVYGIVKQHNGYINCYSEPGNGTTFKIYIPLIKEGAERTEEAGAAIPKAGTETILIAEDEANVRKLMADVLKGHGYKVIEASDGENAVDKFKENKDRVHLLLFDLIMPKKNGKDAYEDIKGIRHDMKAIFMSGYAKDIIRRFGIEESIEFISKPVPPNELLRKVREKLDK